jgi:carotenoid 1,2-hydratase
VDAVSDDKKHALTIIALLGSVFSPYYARSIDMGDGEPLDHSSMNVALYGPRADAWAMTERDRSAVARDARSLSIGPSSMHWSGAGLSVAFDEITAPIPSRVRGSLRLTPLDVTRFSATLDAAGNHLWAPIAPCATIEVDLAEPSLRWRGSAYFDSNMGAEPLGRAFSSWTWSRACDERRAAVTYDVARRRDEPLDREVVRRERRRRRLTSARVGPVGPHGLGPAAHDPRGSRLITAPDPDARGHAVLRSVSRVGSL